MTKRNILYVYLEKNAWGPSAQEILTTICQMFYKGSSVFHGCFMESGPLNLA